MLKLTCRLNLHRWQYVTKGQFFEGFMYPIRYRNCKSCSIKQVEIIDTNNEKVVWQASTTSF